MSNKVAFGSEKDHLFESLAADITTGMKVWIYASKTGSDHIVSSLSQRVCFVGDFGGSTETGLDYTHLHSVRPPSAKMGDSSWLVLWLVRNLKPVDPPRLYSDFLSAKTGKPVGKAPLGPMLICPPVG
jgi:hypothetical protein